MVRDPLNPKLSSLRQKNSNVFWANLSKTARRINGREGFTIIPLSYRNLAYLHKNIKVAQSDRSQVATKLLAESSAVLPCLFGVRHKVLIGIS